MSKIQKQMKKVFLTLAAAVFTLSVYSQEVKVQEPEFVGEAVLLKADSTTELLEKASPRSDQKAGLTMMTGFGKIKTNMVVDGCCSPLKIEKGSNAIKIIIRADNNKFDPSTLFQIIKFDVVKGNRKSELASFGVLSGSKTGNMKKISFVGKKFGEASYILSVVADEPGEYGVMILDSKATALPAIISCFGVK